MVALVAPLDWGLGHSTRCIPIIDELIKQGNTVVCAADGASADVLKKQFPDITHIDLRGYRIKYSSSNSQLLSILLQIPKISYSIFKEHLSLSHIVNHHNIDVVISDNRYGLYNKKAHTVFITHQVYIKTPIPYLSTVINNINHHFIKKYNKCWVPDIDDVSNLSGELSYDESDPQFINNQIRKGKLSYIGVLSRFKYKPETTDNTILAIISGVEPQRSILQNKLINALRSSPIKAEIVLGLPSDDQEPTTIGNLTIYPYLGSEELGNKILKSKYIICRSGYSTVMDMATLRKNPIFIPTLGQTEQEYLARHAEESGWAYTMSQNDIDIDKAIKEIDHLQNARTAVYNNLEREVKLLTCCKI